MKTEVNPQDTNRAEAFELWMSSPMPMVTLTKTFDVSNLIRASRRLGTKFNALLCSLMDCHTPGFPVHHQLPELAQTHVHRVSDTIQPSHSLSSPFLPAFSLSQHQGLFK